MTFIFNYEREDMFKQILSQLSHMKPVVLDDGSSYFIDYPNTIRFKNGGKEKFWEKWFVAFRIAEGSKDDFFLFMPNDFLDLDLDRMRMIHEQLNDEPYVYNIINDGRDSCWIPFKGVHINDETIQVGFTDCGFFCNRKALEAINFQIDPVDKRRFERRDISSGVGQQLTMKFTRQGVPMYKPLKSLAEHGNHPSVMHGKHRDKVKLISR